MRLFVAVFVPGDIAAVFREVRLSLNGRSPAIRWADENNIHVTLKFLGEVPDDRRRFLEEGLSALAEFHAFSVELFGLGAFPSEKSPRVLWAGVRRGRAELDEVAGRVERVLEEMGFPPADHPFQAHVTLGRLKSSPRRPDFSLKFWSSAEFGTFPVDHVCLVQSVLRSSGPVYTVLKRFPLRQED